MNSSGKFFTMVGEFGGDAMTWDRQSAKVSQITILDPFVELTVFFSGSYSCRNLGIGYRGVTEKKNNDLFRDRCRQDPVKSRVYGFS